jgi:hypothetical protein
MSVVAAEGLWTNAGFKETDLAFLRGDRPSRSRQTLTPTAPEAAA